MNPCDLCYDDYLDEYATQAHLGLILGWSEEDMDKYCMTVGSRKADSLCRNHRLQLFDLSL
jgi:hypothetical protein